MPLRVLAAGEVGEEQLDGRFDVETRSDWTGSDVASADLVVVDATVDPDPLTAVPETPVVVLARELPETWQRAVLSSPHVHRLSPSTELDSWIDDLLKTAGSDVRATVVETADVPLCAYDQRGQFRYVNPSMAAFLDQPRTEVLETPVWSWSQELEADRFEEYWASFDRGEVRRHETRHVTENGTEMPVEVTTTETGIDDERIHVSTVRSLRDEYRARSEATQQRRKLERLHAAAREMDTEDEEDAIYRRMAEAAEDILDLDQCTVGIVDDEGIVRLAASTSGMTEDGYAEPPVDSETAGLAGKSYRRKETYLIHDLVDSEIANPIGDYRSCLSVPIGDLGVFQAVSTEAGAFNATDKELVELLTAHVTEAIERIRSAESLRESQRQLSTLISNLRGMVYRSPDGDELAFVSDGAADLTGYDPAALEGKSYTALVDEHHRAKRTELIEAALDAREPFQYEYRIRTADGGQKWVWEQGRGVFEDGSLRAIEGFVTDVTERHEHRRTLEALQSTTRELMAAETEDAIARVTVDAAWSVLGHPIAAVWLPDDDGQFVPVATRSRTEAVPFPTVEDGPIRAVSDTHEHRLLTDEEHAAVHGRGVDVGSELLVPLGEHGVLGVATTQGEAFADTDRRLVTILAANAESALDRAARERAIRQREAELARQNEQLDRFASAVSHDLRNPINLAQGYLELSREGHPDALEKVESTIDRMERIVDEVLALARDGRTIENPEATAFEPVVEKAWDGVAVDDLNLELRTDGPETIETDRPRLRRLFENLFRNVREHADGATTVRVHRVDGGFTVEDDGTGIPNNQQDRVLAHGYSTAKDGTGFGLAIVQAIADAHGWKVTVEESDLGGAAFRIEH